MDSLKELQTWLQKMLINPTNQEQAGQVINSSRKLSAQQHIAIYQRSYLARLRECMAQQFKGLAYALGPDLFRMFSDQYLQQYPPESYTLNDLGRRFAPFLSATRPDAEKEEKEDWPDFMIELAQFEYAITMIFDAHAPEDYALASTDTSEENLRLLPLFHLFEHRFPVCSYYKSVLNDQAPELPFPESSFCVVIRKHYKLGLFELLPAQYVFLQYLKNGHSVPQALQLMSLEHGKDFIEMQNVWMQWKARWIAGGFFVGTTLRQV